VRLAFVGRFQPFHRGHMRVFEEFSDRHEVVAVVADAGERTRDDPLSAEQRVEVVESCLDTEVFVQEDHPESDERWCRELLEATQADGAVTGNDWTRRAVEEHSDAEVLEPEMHRRSLYSGTEIRTRIRSGDEWRYLVPDCALEVLESRGLVEEISGTAIDYEFDPGWKPEHARN